MDGQFDKSTIDVVPSGGPLGAEIKGVDVTEVDAAQFTDIRQALHDHQVILLRDQDIDDPKFLEFARFFGEIDMPRKTRIDNDPWIPEHPEIIVISKSQRRCRQGDGCAWRGRSILACRHDVLGQGAAGQPSLCP